MSIVMTRPVEGTYGRFVPVSANFTDSGEMGCQLPCEESITVLENGMFVKYDQVEKKVTADSTSSAKWGLVYNEPRRFELDTPGHRSYKKHYAMKVADSFDGKIYPRVFYNIPVGRTMITNQVAAGTYELKDYLIPVLPSTDGWKGGAILTKLELPESGDPATTINNYEEVWQIIEANALPDGTKALKITKVR